MGKKFGIKEVVAMGIGTALFVVLTTVQIPIGIPNTALQVRAAVLAFMSAVYGPVVGGVIGFAGSGTFGCSCCTSCTSSVGCGDGVVSMFCSC